MKYLNLSIHKIIEAKYGIENKYIDVLQFISNENNFKFEVSPNFFNGDPYYGKNKELIIKMNNNHIFLFNDNDVITILNEEEKFNFELDEFKKQISLDSNKYILITIIYNIDNLNKWLIYHLSLGFNIIYIINKSNINIEDIIKNKIFYNKIIIKEVKDNKSDLFLLNTYAIPFVKENCMFFIYLPMNEYIILKDKKIHDLINEYDENVLIIHHRKESNEVEYNYSFRYIIKVSNNINKFISEDKIEFKNDVYYCNILKKKYLQSSSGLFNNIFPRTNTLLKSYIGSIKYLNHENREYLNFLEKNTKITFGFIILRHVRCFETNKLWINCYESIRKFYKNTIYIIDDNSNNNFLTNINLENCKIINSKFKKRGEILPYYYYYFNNFCDRVIFLHDSHSINKYIDFINIKDYYNFTRIFTFKNSGYKNDIKYFNEQINCLNYTEDIYKFHIENINNLVGCAGVCFIIDYNFLNYIQNKYNIINLVSCIDTRDKRKTLERVMSCLFEKENKTFYYKTRTSLLGNIFKNIDKQKTNDSYINKFFVGR